MNSLEYTLQETLEEIADGVSHGDVPPLHLHRTRRRLRLPGGHGGGRWAQWLAPLAAATAVAAVIIGSVAVSGTIGSRQRTGSASVPSGLPPYYVALRFAKGSTCCGPSQPLLPRTKAVVVSTATGAVLATIAPPTPQDTFVGVTGAAGDRTFVLGVQQYGKLYPTRFYLLRINPTGAPGAGPRARLSPLHIPPDTAQLLNFAVSPQGTSLAVLDVWGLRVVSLATGAERTWNRPSACFGGFLLGGANTGARLSWAADGRRLGAACTDGTPRQIGVWLLDTTAPGTSLIKHSQRLVPGPVVSANAQPPWNGVVLTGDGSTVVGVLQMPRGHRPATEGAIQELAEFSAQTGKLLRVVNRMPVWNFVDFEQVLWSSPSGHTLLVSDTTRYPGKRRAFFLLNNAGTLTGHHFVPLPHWSIDTMAAAW